MKLVDYQRVHRRIISDRLVNLKFYNSNARTSFESIDLAATHFLDIGIKVGLDPNPLFSSEFYLNEYRAQIPSSITPFEHYVTVGETIGYNPHPVVNADWVKRQLRGLGSNDSVLTALLHKCAHYSLDPNPVFSVRYYLENNPKVRTHRVHPILHYLETGARQGLRTHPLFWSEWMATAACRPGPISLLDYLHDRSLHKIPPNPYFSPEPFLTLGSYRGDAPLFTYLASWPELTFSPNPNLDLSWFRKDFAQQLSITSQDPLTFLVRQGLRDIPASPGGSKLHTINNGTVLPAYTAGSGPLRIAFFSHNLRFQGAQNSLFELVHELKNRRWVEPVVFAPDDGPMKAAYQEAGIKVVKYVLPVLGLDDEKHYHKLYDALKQQLQAVDPDIVHCNTVQTYAAIAAAGALKIPSIWNIRESEDLSVHTEFLKPAAKQLFEAALQNATRFVFVSQTTADKFASSGQDLSYDVIHNGINYNRLVSMSPLASRSYARAVRGYSKSDIVFFNVGTWTERKGQIDILKALEHLDRRIWSNIRIHLIGANESAYTKEILEIYRQLPKSLRERITIEAETRTAAERNSVIDAFLASDVFLFTSRIESYPRVVNEAMYFALPIISTPCFGVLEQMRDGREGVFYDAGANHQLASRMEHMYVDEIARSKFAANATYASRFLVDQYDDMVRSYLRTYQSALA